MGGVGATGRSPRQSAPQSPTQPRPVAVALGTNLGDRQAHLGYAIERLGQILSDLRVSSFHETEPVGVAGPQPPFLNAAAVGWSAVPAASLLETLLAIEAGRGRERPHAGAARTLDLDLILCGDEIVDDATTGGGADLRLPHPRFRERAFVLDPLVEIAPDLRDPVTGRTIRELHAALSGSRPGDPPPVAPTLTYADGTVVGSGRGRRRNADRPSSNNV